jgi:putative tryptophan/tyrosine transport system substrate-binding protein
MRRRELIAIAGTGLIAWPLVACAQQQARSARLGYLGFGSPANAATVIRGDALRAGLRDLGYVAGKNLLIEFRWADTVERPHERAAELVCAALEVLRVSWIAASGATESG